MSSLGTASRHWSWCVVAGTFANCKTSVWELLLYTIRYYRTISDNLGWFSLVSTSLEIGNETMWNHWNKTEIAELCSAHLCTGPGKAAEWKNPTEEPMLWLWQAVGESSFFPTQFLSAGRNCGLTTVGRLPDCRRLFWLSSETGPKIWRASFECDAPLLKATNRIPIYFNTIY